MLKACDSPSYHILLHATILVPQVPTLYARLEQSFDWALLPCTFGLQLVSPLAVDFGQHFLNFLYPRICFPEQDYSLT